MHLAYNTTSYIIILHILVVGLDKAAMEYDTLFSRLVVIGKLNVFRDNLPSRFRTKANELYPGLQIQVSLTHTPLEQGVLYGQLIPQVI